MGKVRITVLKTDYDEKLAREYGDNVTGPCSHLKPGQVIECERHYQPEGFCGEAWKCIQHYVYALYHGASEPFGKGWMKNGNVAIATCNDGLRPVTFKIERVDDGAGKDSHMSLYPGRVGLPGQNQCAYPG